MKLLLVDDERLARQELRYFLTKLSTDLHIFEADSYDNALEILRNLDLDAVFLDIDLAGFSGLDLAKMVQQEKPHLAIIFSTAFDEHAITAFKLNAVDYILKPFNAIDVERVFNKISNKNINNTILSAPNDKITIWLADKAVVLDVSDILYINADNKEILIHCKYECYKTKQSLTYFETRLAIQGFMRIQRSFLVNTQMVIEIIPWFNNEYALRLKDVKEVIPVSRSKIKDVKKLFEF